ncbi:efflux RND transporter permease subunit [Abyssisolibacter fermentans]|uniref:efflux RND transporter permease subunit n=1 Tax=Abyssisolibacter fermentans TaxID=1766203 RepID=UPI000831E1C8|nr:efflux RND transporter permease subunit [Abyssisolibacter fermentans]
MNNIVKTAINKRKITLFLAVMVAIVGIYSYYYIPKQENPDATGPVAMITTVYPGAAPKEVEKLITNKIEDIVTEIDGFEKVQSQSKNSVSVVIVTLENKADIDKSWNQLRQNLDDIKNDLPDGCMDSEINTNLIDTAGMIISLSGDGYSYEQLAYYAEEIKKELTKIDGVSRIEVDGKLKKEVKVNVKMDKLNQYDLSLEDVVNLIKMQNIDIPSGSINFESGKINVNTPGRFTSLKDIENIVITASEETGALVRLKDVANINFEYEDGSYKFKHNGKNTILLTGYFDTGKNVILIGEDVRVKLEDLKTQIPDDVSTDEVLYQPTDVKNSVNNFTKSLLQGIIFVIMVIFFGVGFRNALVVSTAIPLTMLITFISMYVLGIEIQFVSIMALIISLGILVDNSIVVSQAIQNHIDAGLSNTESAFEGVKETARPVFTSTITTIVAFATLLMVPGSAGEFLSSVPIVVIISLIASYAVAMIVIPAIACIFFKESKHKNKEKKQERTRKFFNKLLEFGLKRKIVTLLIALSIFGVALSLISKIRLQFFPYADKNIIYIDVNSEVVGNLDKTEKLTDEIYNILKNQKEVTSYTTAIGISLPKFYLTVLPSAPSNDFAQIMIKLDLNAGNRFKSNEEFAAYLQEELDTKIVGGKTKVNLLEYAAPIGAPVTVRVNGNDLNQIKEVSNEIVNKLNEIPGTLNVRDDDEGNTYEYELNIDSEIASSMGITKYDIVKQMNTALKGSNSSVYRKNGSEFDIIVKSDIESLNQLENLAVKSSITGNKTLLKEIAEIELESKVNTIKHFNKDITITVYSNVKPGYSSVAIQDELKNEKLKDINLNGVEIVFEGEKDQINDLFGVMGIAALFALFAIYIILLIEFNSFVQPLLILFTVPLSFIGCILGLLIFRNPLSATSAMGVVSLIGIVVNNAILLIDVINHSRAQGKSLNEACIEAVDRRFRPILLSTITTVMGLIPLVLSRNPLFVPMSVALMSGLLVSTILTMVIIPVFYNLVEEKLSKVEKNKSKEIV